MAKEKAKPEPAAKARASRAKEAEAPAVKAKATKAAPAKDEALPPLVITPAKGLPVDGNFAQILGYLKLREKEVSKMKLKESDIERAKLIKKEASAYRKAVEERVKTAIALLFDGPKDVLKSKVKDLYDYIDKIAGVADKVLDDIEADRVAELNKAYEARKAELQEQYKLDGERLEMVEFRKWFYNKTPSNNEAIARADMETQFKKLAKEQADHEADVRIIQNMCAEDPRLNVKLYIDRLELCSASMIIDEIAEERKRLDGLEAEPKDNCEEAKDYEEEDEDDGEEQEAAAETEPIVLGIPGGILEFKTDFPGRTLKKRVELEYPCDMGDLITDLFDELRKHGIIVRPVKDGEAA